MIRMECGSKDNVNSLVSNQAPRPRLLSVSSYVEDNPELMHNLAFFIDSSSEEDEDSTNGRIKRKKKRQIKTESIERDDDGDEASEDDDEGVQIQEEISAEIEQNDDEATPAVVIKPELVPRPDSVNSKVSYFYCNENSDSSSDSDSAMGEENQEREYGQSVENHIIKADQESQPDKMISFSQTNHQENSETEELKSILKNVHSSDDGHNRREESSEDGFEERCGISSERSSEEEESETILDAHTGKIIPNPNYGFIKIKGKTAKSPVKNTNGIAETSKYSSASAMVFQQKRPILDKSPAIFNSNHSWGKPLILRRQPQPQPLQFYFGQGPSGFLFQSQNTAATSLREAKQRLTFVPSPSDDRDTTDTSEENSDKHVSTPQFDFGIVPKRFFPNRHTAPLREADQRHTFVNNPKEDNRKKLEQNSAVSYHPMFEAWSSLLGSEDDNEPEHPQEDPLADVSTPELENNEEPTSLFSSSPNHMTKSQSRLMAPPKMPPLGRWSKESAADSGTTKQFNRILDCGTLNTIEEAKIWVTKHGIWRWRNIQETDTIRGRVRIYYRCNSSKCPAAIQIFQNNQEATPQIILSAGDHSKECKNSTASTTMHKSPPKLRRLHPKVPNLIPLHADVTNLEKPNVINIESIGKNQMKGKNADEKTAAESKKKTKQKRHGAKARDSDSDESLISEYIPSGTQFKRKKERRNGIDGHNHMTRLNSKSLGLEPNEQLFPPKITFAGSTLPSTSERSLRRIGIATVEKRPELDESLDEFPIPILLPQVSEIAIPEKRKGGYPKLIPTLSPQVPISRKRGTSESSRGGRKTPTLNVAKKGRTRYMLRSLTPVVPPNPETISVQHDSRSGPKTFSSRRKNSLSSKTKKRAGSGRMKINSKQQSKRSKSANALPLVEASMAKIARKLVFSTKTTEKVTYTLARLRPRLSCVSLQIRDHCKSCFCAPIRK